MNLKKLKKTTSIVIEIEIAFFAFDWLTKAMAQPTYFGKGILLLISLIMMMVIVYFNLDKTGNF